MKRNHPDIVDEILKLSAQMRTKYRTRQTIKETVTQVIPEKAPPRGANRKNLLRRLRKPTTPKPSKPQKVAKLIERTELDSDGRQVTRYYGDPMAWMGAFSQKPHELVEPHGAARDAAIMQMHADGLPDKKIAELANVTVKTVERALKDKRVRHRTRRAR
jgi:DNA-binding NarL/FixJ family response regulator